MKCVASKRGYLPRCPRRLERIYRRQVIALKDALIRNGMGPTAATTLCNQIRHEAREYIDKSKV